MPVGDTLVINRNAVAEKMPLVYQGRGKGWILGLYWPKMQFTGNPWSEINLWSPLFLGGNGQVHPFLNPGEVSGIPSWPCMVWGTLTQHSGGGDVVAGCSPEFCFPTSKPIAVARVAPQLEGADSQPRNYLYWFSNSCQGGGKHYSATSGALSWVGA